MMAVWLVGEPPVVTTPTTAAAGRSAASAGVIWSAARTLPGGGTGRTSGGSPRTARAASAPMWRRSGARATR
jgi:hypothetical protein